MDALALRDRREIYRIDFLLRNGCRSRDEVKLPSQWVIVPLRRQGRAIAGQRRCPLVLCALHGLAAGRRGE